MIQAKPCPFCGREFDTLDAGSSDMAFRPEHGFNCARCGASGPSIQGKLTGDLPRDRQEAIEAWNRRDTARETD